MRYAAFRLAMPAALGLAMAARAFQLVDQRTLNLEERVVMRRAELTVLGCTHFNMAARGHDNRRKIFALVNPAFGTLAAEETMGLRYAQQGDALFSLYASLFTGEKAK